MEAKIKARIAELEQAEQDTIMQLTVIKNVLTELRALLLPDKPTIIEEPTP